MQSPIRDSSVVIMSCQGVYIAEAPTALSQCDDSSPSNGDIFIQQGRNGCCRRSKIYKIGLVAFVTSSLFLAAVIIGVYTFKQSSGSEVAGEDYDYSWENSPRLPTDTIPYSYDIFLNPDLEGGTFNGIVSIKINITSPRSYLLLHSNELDISETELYDENGRPIEIVDTYDYTDNQFWVIILKENIVLGKYELKLSFNGSLLDKTVGFYRSSYTADDGSERYAATTQFEPTYAREAFPCFDEPRYKAEFTVHIVRPSGNKYFALSNMNQVNEEPDTPSAGLTKVSFAPTPPMSTYLACFIVCDFEHLEPLTTSQGTPITVYSKPGQQNNTKFSRNVAQKVMNYFINYFGIEYPLPKIDLIAIPDFESEAMENWGLITFAETELLTTSEDSFYNLEMTANTVAHELAHMWFGNLVTMDWWDDLWLNEGFATFLANKVVDIVEKDLFSNINFVIGSLQPAFVYDAAKSSHPIIEPVNSPDEINEIFDDISYNKGSSLLRMFESYSPKSFQTAVVNYLKKYKYRNTLTVNLWTEMEKEYGIPNITRMLNTWTKQEGFPLVTVKREGDKLILSQRRYLVHSSSTFNASDSPYQYKWDIPILYVTSKNPKKVNKFIYKLEENETSIDLEKGTEWFKLNYQLYGFYRVNYTQDIWLSFLNLLNSQVLENPEDRVNILDDAFALSEGGYLSYEIPFKLTSYLQAGTEKHYAPWVVVAKNINTHKYLLYRSPAYDKLMKFGTSLLSSVVKDDIWEENESSSNLEKELKTILLAFSCHMEIPRVIAKANEIFTNWIQGKTEKPNSNIRSLIYKYGMRGPQESFSRQKMWILYFNESNPLEKDDYLNALATGSNPVLTSQLLESMKNADFVRSQDYFTFLHYMCYTPEGGEVVWNYLRNNWDYFVKRFTLNDLSLGQLIPRAVAYFSTREKLAEVEDFFKRNPEAGAGAAGRRRALEKIRTNINWRKTYYQNIENALNSLVK